ncbi:MAG: putative nitrogen fixation protein NifT [Magnetococcales bacterium]|nr:putative nitrogen fixation protein NifT [Magnetococcales bacterium]NGZ29604.1 putative nitrogen fixation protein NifT [Magnetococcales bacterium]
MPEVMLRINEQGNLLCYVAKKDLETVVQAVEFDQEDRWGGTFHLANGEKFYLDPLPAKPRIPVTLRMRKL